MKVLVVGDPHGQIDKIKKIPMKGIELILLTGDLGFSVLEDFREKFPNQFYNIGIAEQSMAGIAAGLAMSGKKVFILWMITCKMHFQFLKRRFQSI